jgi:hypothetical protein
MGCIDCVSHQATAEVAVSCSKGEFHRHHDPPSIHEPAEVAIIGSYEMCSPGVRSLGGFYPEAGVIYSRIYSRKMECQE